ncbi:MmgE/PrpD family protein [Mesorhizobium sp. CAU 1741]|uniref:MmgE/PrpD family protein n=1 Tax=Mesorhizobium sp. CAU 1741 TaxID=3140366 RepID=UPI00325BACAF
MLKAMAQKVMSETVTSGEIDLRVADIFNAAFAGIASQEGRFLLNRLDAGRHGDAPLVAALVRLAETDDIHLASCITPGSVVIPVALAASAAGDGTRFDRAVATGYAAGIRLGLAIGGARAMEVGVWPTMVAAPVMAAATAAVMRGGDAAHMANAMAIALAGRGGRIGRPVGSSTARWLNFARAVAAGVEAEADAAAGLAGDVDIVSPAWLSAQSNAGMIAPDVLVADHGPGIADTGYKPFATARQGAAAIAAFRQLLDEEGFGADQIDHLLVEVPSASHAMVSRPLNPADRLSTLSSLGYQLALAALSPDRLFDAARLDAAAENVLSFARRVDVRPAPDLDDIWPELWAGRFTVQVAGRSLRREIKRMDTDAGSPAAEAAVREKFARMSSYRPALVDLSPGSCSDPDGRAAIWSDLLALCATRRKELLADEYH